MEFDKNKLRFKELSFEERTHTYTLEGEVIPSVTHIMGPISAAHYSNVRQDALEHAARRGTSAHNAIETYLEFGIADVSDEGAPYLEAFVRWMEDVSPEVVGAELRVYHKELRYAGTCDLLCKIDGKLCLVDYKTTSSVNEALCGVQLEAYARALASHGVEVERKMILHLKKNSDYKEHWFESPDRLRWDVFEGLLGLYNAGVDDNVRGEIWAKLREFYALVPDALTRVKLAGGLSVVFDYAVKK